MKYLKLSSIILTYFIAAASVQAMDETTDLSDQPNARSHGASSPSSNTHKRLTDSASPVNVYVDAYDRLPSSASGSGDPISFVREEQPRDIFEISATSQNQRQLTSKQIRDYFLLAEKGKKADDDFLRVRHSWYTFREGKKAPLSVNEIFTGFQRAVNNPHLAPVFHAQAEHYQAQMV